MDDQDVPSTRLFRTVEELLTRPFSTEEYQDHTSATGPGHQILVLSSSRDFSDDPPYEVVEAALTELRDAYHQVSGDLAAQWGEPELVSLDQHLRRLGELARQGQAPPEPMLRLGEMVDGMRVWRHPGRSRWLALAICQGDKELPFELTAVVGRLPSAGLPAR